MLAKIYVKLMLRLQSLFMIKVKIKIRDSKEILVSKCASHIEYYRFASLYSKEPGTVNWLHRTFKEGSVLLDIGANVGLYSMLAAKIGGPSSCVYAFEPNSFNFSKLLQNINVNGLSGSIRPLNIALSSKKLFQEFYYNSDVEGASGSQVGQPVTEYGEAFDVVLSEHKPCFSIDGLSDSGVFEKSITHIKIDVDGHEYHILKGMEKFLTGSLAPEYIQIEINPGLSTNIDKLVESYGYHLLERTGTLTSQQSSSRLEDVAHNALYCKSADA